MPKKKCVERSGDGVGPLQRLTPKNEKHRKKNEKPATSPKKQAGVLDEDRPALKTRLGDTRDDRGRFTKKGGAGPLWVRGGEKSDEVQTKVIL